MPSRLCANVAMKLPPPDSRSLPLPVLPEAKAWRSCLVKSLADAEELLDRLEACHFEEREFIIHDNSSFEVRWR